MKKFKKIQKLDAAKLKKEELFQVKGGLRLQCTSGTRSICHIDGTDDADSFKL